MLSVSPSRYWFDVNVIFQSGNRNAGINAMTATRITMRLLSVSGSSKNAFALFSQFFIAGSSVVARSVAPALSSVYCAIAIRMAGLPLLRFGQRSAAFDQQITLHLLVQRRAEVGAVVREDSGFVGHELDGFGLARIDHHVDVVFAEAEAMQFIGRLFDVRDVNGHGVALIDLDLVRLE